MRWRKRSPTCWNYVSVGLEGERDPQGGGMLGATVSMCKHPREVPPSPRCRWLQWSRITSASSPSRGQHIFNLHVPTDSHQSGRNIQAAALPSIERTPLDSRIVGFTHEVLPGVAPRMACCSNNNINDTKPKRIIILGKK